MFVFVCHKAKKQAIHHVLKRTCFLAHFQKLRKTTVEVDFDKPKVIPPVVKTTGFSPKHGENNRVRHTLQRAFFLNYPNLT